MAKATLSFDRLRVLIIEDRKETRTMIKTMLGEMGINQVFEAGDGREGMEFIDIAADMVDIVLCDWNMPGMSGLQLLQQIRSVNGELPFLLVTGRSDRDSVLEAKGAGVTAYIRKPFSLNELEAKLRIIHEKAHSAAA